MKNRQHIFNWGGVFFLLTVVLALFSWIGSIYGVGEIQSLLSTEGVRWVLGHTVDNYVQSPALGGVLVLFMGLGIGIHAGLYNVLKRLSRKEKQLSRKERRGLTLATVVLGSYLGLVLLTLFLPWNFLQSVTGSWTDSPFSNGLVYIVSIGLGLSGMVYGYVSDVFHRVEDVINGMSCLISRRSSYFVSLFFVVQFFSSLVYTGMADWLNISEGLLHAVYLLFSFLPLFVCKSKG